MSVKMLEDVCTSFFIKNLVLEIYKVLDTLITCAKNPHTLWPVSLFYKEKKTHVCNI